MPQSHRINFQLEKTVLAAFTKQAQELLTTKSKLLLQWLQNTKEVRLIKRDRHTKMAQYQLRVPSRLAAHLSNMAGELEIPRSALMRNVIKTNLLKTGKGPSEGDLLLITKTYAQILRLLEAPELKNTMGELDRMLLAARANLEIGPVEIEKVQKALERIKQLHHRNPENRSALARIKLVEGELLGLTGKLNQGIEVMNEGKMVAYSGGDYILLSDIYYTAALGLHIAGRIDEAVYNYESALEYITVQSEPYRYARIHIHLAMMSMFQLDLKRASLYLAKAHRIINKSETPHYHVILKTVEAYLWFIGGEYPRAIPRLAECFEEFKNMVSAFGMYATLQTLAKAHLMAGNIAESQGIFQELEKQERLLTQPFSQSRSDFFQLLIQSREGAKEPFAAMQSAIEMRKGHLNVEMEEYILGSALYLYGDKPKGLKILKRLAKKGGQELIRANARKTIKDKKLHPVSVI